VEIANMSSYRSTNDTEPDSTISNCFVITCVLCLLVCNLSKQNHQYPNCKQSSFRGSHAHRNGKWNPWIEAATWKHRFHM